MSAGRSINSLSQEWGTPEKYVTAVREVLGGVIHLDPCSNEHSIVRAKVEYRLPERNGLLDSWDYPTIYVNPPYGRDQRSGTSIKNWLQRCSMAFRDYGSEVLALVPVATNTRHWKDYVFSDATSVCFLYDTRLRFLENGQDVGKGAPMSCAMIYWGRDIDAFQDVFDAFGAVVDLRPLHTRQIGYREHIRQFELSKIDSK